MPPHTVVVVSQPSAATASSSAASFTVRWRRRPGRLRDSWWSRAVRKHLTCTTKESLRRQHEGSWSMHAFYHARSSEHVPARSILPRRRGAAARSEHRDVQRVLRVAPDAKEPPWKIVLRGQPPEHPRGREIVPKVVQHEEEVDRAEPARRGGGCWKEEARQGTAPGG